MNVIVFGFFKLLFSADDIFWKIFVVIGKVVRSSKWKDGQNDEKHFAVIAMDDL